VSVSLGLAFVYRYLFTIGSRALLDIKYRYRHLCKVPVGIFYKYRYRQNRCIITCGAVGSASAGPSSGAWRLVLVGVVRLGCLLAPVVRLCAAGPSLPDPVGNRIRHFGR